MQTPVIGFVGWSGSGKTTLLSELIPHLVGRGVRLSTVKHTHHDIEIDKPGKDSYRHRMAGATEVLVTSPNRWALVHELRDAPEPDMESLLDRLGPVDLVLVEGFKSHRFPKIEIHRPSVGKPLIAAEDTSVIAVASDEALPGLRIPVLALSDVAGIANFIIAHCGLEAERGHDEGA